MILVDKYRPKSFSDKYLVKTKPIIELEDRLKATREFPHLLFSGGPGTGKTTIAHILIKELANAPDARLSDLCLDLNASDSRKIEHVRGVIKEYAKIRSMYSDKKFVFLDEVDAMTRDAQQALRRIMEDHSKNCMFILSCNYPNKLIQPLKSRCSHYEFPQPTVEDIVPVMKEIVNTENINITDDALHEVVKQVGGDIRETINWLDGHSGNLSITIEDVQIEDTSFQLTILAESGILTTEINDQIVKTVVNSDPRVVVNGMFDAVSKYIESGHYVDIVAQLAKTHHRILSMSQTDGQLQLYSFIVYLHYTINDNIKMTKEIEVLTEKVKDPMVEVAQEAAKKAKKGEDVWSDW